MADGRSLRECLLENTDDLEAILKMILAWLICGDRSCGSLTSLCRLFRKKHAQLTELLKKVPEHQRREQEIRRLEEAVKAQDEIIGKLQKDLMDLEAALTKMVYQAGEKLKEVRQGQANRVDSETVIRYAHTISRSHSVTAPPGWKRSDPIRPYPTEAEISRSKLAAASARTQSAPSYPSFLRQPASGMLRGAGRGTSPMPPFPAAMHQSQRSWSPYGAFLRPASPSPRGRVQPVPRTSGTQQSGLATQADPFRIGSSSTMSAPPSSSSSSSSSYLAMPKKIPPLVRRVEQMSSESSSSSSTEDGSPS